MDGMKVVLGTSVEGLAIEAFLIGPDDAPTFLVLAGFHGDEPKGVSIAERLRDRLERTPESTPHLRWVIVPVVNPDGYARRRRRNARGVDINRNFPTSNWELGKPRSRMFGGNTPRSEPETRAVMHAVARFRPAAMITVHSISEGRHCNNYDGPGRNLAEVLARHNGYPVIGSIGYPTPGSFGTWAGAERGIPTVTLELPTAHSLKRCWSENRDAILAAAEFIGPIAGRSARTSPTVDV